MSPNSESRRGSAVGVSGFPGVWPAKTPGRWIGNYRHENRQYYCGTHNTPQAAYDAVVEKGFEMSGEYPGQARAYTPAENSKETKKLIAEGLADIAATPLERGNAIINELLKGD